MFKTLSGLTDNDFWRAPHQFRLGSRLIGAGRKRAALRYIWCLLAGHVFLLANMHGFLHIIKH